MKIVGGPTTESLRFLLDDGTDVTSDLKVTSLNISAHPPGFTVAAITCIVGVDLDVIAKVEKDDDGLKGESVDED